MPLLSVLDIAASGMNAQSVRLNLTASNLANADSSTSSTGQLYRARHPVFSAILRDGQPAVVNVEGIQESTRAPRTVHRPGHPQADEAGYVKLPNVNPVEEMANMISASRSYQTNAEVATAAKEMLLRVLRLGE